MSFLTSPQTDQQAAEQNAIFLHAQAMESARDAAVAKQQAANVLLQKRLDARDELERLKQDGRLELEEKKAGNRANEIGMKSSTDYMADAIENNKKSFDNNLRTAQINYTRVMSNPDASDELKAATANALNDIIKAKNEYDAGVQKAYTSSTIPTVGLKAAYSVPATMPESTVLVNNYLDPIAMETRAQKLKNLQLQGQFLQAKTHKAITGATGKGGGGTGGGGAITDPRFADAFAMHRKATNELEQVKLQRQAFIESNMYIPDKNNPYGTSSTVTKKKLREFDDQIIGLSRNVFNTFGVMADKAQGMKKVPPETKTELQRIYKSASENNYDVKTIQSIDWEGDNPIANSLFGGRQKEWRTEEPKAQTQPTYFMMPW